MSIVSEQFCILAKSASGAALRGCLLQALNKPSMYFFADLLQVETVDAMKNSGEAEKGVWELLKVFSKGEWKDYERWRGEYPGELLQLLLMSPSFMEN